MALTKAQKHALAFQVMLSATELIAAKHDDGQLDEGLADEPWENITHQLAVWFQKLPGNDWYIGLPEVWNE